MVANKSAAKPAAKGAVPDRLLLVDGSGYIFRAYHALPPLTRKKDGLPTGAVAGFCNMLHKLLQDTFTDGDGTHIAVIFDAGRVTFRNDIYPDYKANRDAPPEDLVPQFEIIRDATRAFNVATIARKGFEADDLIATYARVARAAGAEVIIVSSDKDLMQLVGDGVRMFDPMKNRSIGPDEVREKFGVAPEKVIDVQALAGDSSDNVPGVPGIGVKTAAQLIGEYGDLDTLLSRAGEIKQPKRRESLIENADLARISRDLVTLRDDVEITETFDDFDYRRPDPGTLLAFLDDMEFTRLAARVRAEFEVAGQPSLPAPGAVAEAQYLTITEEADLAQWVAAAHKAGAVAIKALTAVPDPLRDALVGVALALGAGRAAFVPVAGAVQGDLIEASQRDALTLATVTAALKPLLEDPGVLKIGHDIKTDILALARHGISVAPIEDAMLLSYGREAGLHRHGLEDLAKLVLDSDIAPVKSLTGSGKSKISLDQAPREAVSAYACEAADTALRLAGELKPALLADHLMTVYETLDRPLVPVLADMERAGIRVDPARLNAMSKDFAKRIAALEGDILALAGREFNVGSPKQLGEILFDEMGLPGGKKGKTGAYSTTADVLEKCAGEGIELAQKVLDFRQLTKLKNTYTDTLPEEINPETGRVHTNYAMAVAPTGRLSSNDPNLQNIPIRSEEGRKIRTAFVPAKGCAFLSADYSQIELRLLAHMADILALREAFSRGEDIHARTAAEVFGIPATDMNPMVRRRAKAINFGIIYGISPFGLARQLGIEQREAKLYIDAYFERYPGIRDYMESAKEACRTDGYVTTLFGRRVHLPGIRDKNPARRAFSERAAINAPLQGSAADIIKRAMIRIPGALLDAGLGAKMLLQVHDELVFEVPDKEIEETGAVVKRVMEGAAHLRVPLTVETGSGANWDEAH